MVIVQFVCGCVSLRAWFMTFCLCSFGEFVAPNKTLNKNDHYQGYWKDGKMHGLGTYRWAAWKFIIFSSMPFIIITIIMITMMFG